MTSNESDPHLGGDHQPDGKRPATGRDDGPKSPAPRRRPRSSGTGRAGGDGPGVAGPTEPDAPTFAAALCLRHRRWVVDRTVGDLLPVGWRPLLSWAFDDLSLVVPTGRRLALRRLGAEGGGLAIALEPRRTRPGGDDAWLAAVRLVVSHATAASRATCETCGADARLRPAAGSTLCEAHHNARPPATGEPRRHARPASGDGRRGDGEVAGAKRDAGRLALYELADVVAALAPVATGAARAAAFSWDPEPLRGGEVDTEQTALLRRILGAGEGARWRDLARPDAERIAALDDLARRAPHMREVLDLARRHLGAAMAMGTHTALPPVLLLGEPGTGKTWMAERMAQAMGVPVRRHPMNTATTGDGLTGSHPVWRGARAGLVARSLLAESVANPVLVLDEVDKAASHNGEDALRPLYSCLEPLSASKLVDEFLGFPLDASHVSWLLTANAVDRLPAPILDRLVVVEVPNPDAAQLRAVAEGVFGEANAARRDFFLPPGDDVLDRLAAASPRRMRRAIVDAMARAASTGRRALRADDVVAEPRASRRRAGFGSWS